MITGAAGGLGASVVEALRVRGATLVTPTIDEVRLDDEAQVVALYAKQASVWGSIHLVGGYAMAKIAETTLADFEKQWRLNTVTAFLCCREAVKAIRRTGGGGRIVNVAARPAVQPAGGMIAYTAAKAGVASITQSLAAELTGEGILVNAVVPSIIDTPANRKAMPNADFASWPKASEIAQAIAFLASPANALTSGTLVPVYGKA